MFSKKRKSLVWLLALCFLLSQIITSPIFAQSTGTDRISGADRYKTAVAVSQKGWKTSDYAVLARGDNFADALCAGPLAQKYDGPILLTPPNKLNNDTLEELQRLGVKHLFIAGGVGAVSQSVENTLKANGIDTIERIYGNDRYETSVKIAEKIGDSTKVVLATGSDFPDALSISGIAAKLGMPILLTAKNSLPTTVGNYLQTNTVTQTYVVGGTGVISSEVADNVPSPSRLAGSDRYETNKVIMQNFAGELNFENIYVAVGTQFADALTGAVLAAKSSAPLVLTGKTLPKGTADYLQTKLQLSTKVKGLGGKAAVPSTILAGIVSAKEQIAVEEKYSIAGTYGPETGTKTIQGSVIISSADVTLQNTTIEGDLLLGRSIGDGDVSLRDVTVKGKTIVNGGGPNSIIMYNFNGQTVVVDVPDGSSVRLVAQGNTSVNDVSMESNGTLEQSGTGTGFVTVQIPAGAQVSLSGDFNEVNVEAAGANVTVTSGNITTMNISESATGSGVNLASGSSVGTLNANAQSNVTGQGQITNANVNVNGVTIEQKPSNTTLGDDVDSSNVGGEEIDESDTQQQQDQGSGDSGPSTVAVSGVSVVNASTVSFTSGVAEATIKWNGVVLSTQTVNGVNTITVPLMVSGENNILRVEKSGYTTFTKSDVAYTAPYDMTATLGEWTEDRTEPKTWDDTVEGWITIETQEEPANNWYAWQGRSSPTSVGLTSNWMVETQLRLTQDMVERDGIRASVWLAVEGSNDFGKDHWDGVIDWAILQFKKDSSTDVAGWQSWDSYGTGSWVDLDSISTEAGTYTLTMVYESGTLYQYIDGVLVNSYGINIAEGISAPTHLIIQSYSFGESYGASWKVPTVEYAYQYPVDATIVSSVDELKAAIVESAEGASIYVAPGVYQLTEQLNIEKALTIQGLGAVTIKAVPNTTWRTENGHKHLLAIYAGTESEPVTISNIVIDANSESHAVNTYFEAYGLLNDVTIKNSVGAGLIVNGSTIEANNLNTSGNAWGAVNVDPGSGVTSVSEFILTGTGILGEDNQIWSDGANVSSDVTVSVSAIGFDEYYTETGLRFWTNQVLEDLATITKAGKTTVYQTIQDAVDYAQSDDIILVAAGTYDSFTVNKDGITIMGAEGFGSEITGLVTVNESNVTIDGLYVKYDLSANTGSNAAGIRILYNDNQPSNVTIQNNKIKNTGDNSTNPSAIYLKRGIGLSDINTVDFNCGVTGNIIENFRTGIFGINDSDKVTNNDIEIILAGIGAVMSVDANVTGNTLRLTDNSDPNAEGIGTAITNEEALSLLNNSFVGNFDEEGVSSEMTGQVKVRSYGTT